MNKYSGLSDFEVNKLVAGRLGIDCILQFDQVVVSDGVFGRAIDYCNNWTDAGPLMVENGINFDNHGGLAGIYRASPHMSLFDEMGDGFVVQSNNPCRAIAECYLMMTENEGC